MAKKKPDTVVIVLYLLYTLMLIVSALLLARIFYLEVLWKPNPEIERRLSQSVEKTVLEPTRGNILAVDGRVLAMSFPKYQMVIDPSILKEEYARKSEEDRLEAEARWRERVEAFTPVLAKVCPQKTAQQYNQDIFNGRRNGKRYIKLGQPIEKEAYQTLQECELLRIGRYRGGVWAEPVQTRRYPYGRLAYRTIGFVRPQTEGVSNNFVGIDGKYNSMLHGTEGQLYTKITDEGRIRDNDSLYIDAVNGADVHTTLNIDYQEIADETLRAHITDDRQIEGGCCVIMDVKTGAIRTMVNLKRDEKYGYLDEIENFAIGRRGEPGSVFKITTLMTVLEDGIIKSLDQTIPTNHSRIPGYEKYYETDKHIVKDWEQGEGLKPGNNPGRVPIIFGIKKSSNYVFRYLALMNYANDPKKFIDRLYMYGMGEAFDFDIDGLKTPSIPDPSKKGWSKTDLGQVAMGYTVGVTPLHLITFYNAIANKGRMMKPYLIEEISKDGKTISKRGPSVLNAAICSPATADTLTRGLEAVTEKGGTGWRLGKAKCEVAGKTGTAYVYMEGKDGKPGGYKDENNLRKCQGTFVGFFPADNPQYSIICTIYSKPSKEDYYGGTIPAQVVREVVDKIYDIDPYWNASI